MQPWQPVCPSDRVRRSLARHHEACCVEHAGKVGPLNCLVHGGGQAEIIRREDDLAAGGHSQAALLRSRMNWKNSTPSRNRRFIICGLRTISPTMAAILGARK